MRRLQDMADRHPSVGEVRGRGLMIGIELVKNRETREPLSPQRTEAALSPAMAAVRTAISGRRVVPLYRWNIIALAPPLTISDAELESGLDAIESGLEAADQAIAAQA